MTDESSKVYSIDAVMAKHLENLEFVVDERAQEIANGGLFGRFMIGIAGRRIGETRENARRIRINVDVAGGE